MVIRMAQPRIVTTDTEPAQLLALRVSAHQRRLLDRAAKRRKVSVSAVLRELIDERLGA